MYIEPSLPLLWKDLRNIQLPTKIEQSEKDPALEKLIKQTVNVILLYKKMGFHAVFINANLTDIENLKQFDEALQKFSFFYKHLVYFWIDSAKQTEIHINSAMSLKPNIRLPYLSDQQLSLHPYSMDFPIFSRITFSNKVKEHDRFQYDTKFKDFDIVAIQPTDENATLTILKNANTFEILNLDKLNAIHRITPQILEAARRNIFCEISYGSAVLEKNTFFKLIRILRQAYRINKLHNFILGNGSDQLLSIRSPQDIANIACLLGIDSSVGIHMVTTHCENAFKHGEMRKMGKGSLMITVMPSTQASSSTEVSHDDEELMEDEDEQQQVSKPQPSNKKSKKRKGKE